MNAINRIELAIWRAAAQIPAGSDLRKVFELAAVELQVLTHDDDDNNERALAGYRREYKEELPDTPIDDNCS